MDASAANTLTVDPGPDAGAVALGVPSGPGWLVLRNCPLGGGGPPVDVALLHPKIGVALVDFSPGEADSAGRFRRALDARRFPAIFGGYPPVVPVVLPEDRLPDLGHVLSTGFREEPPLALEGGDAWLPTARAALEAKAEPADPGPPAARRRDVSPRRAAVYILGAAATGAALAAAVVAVPPRRDAGPPPDAAIAVAAAVPRPARFPVPADPPFEPVETVATAAPKPAALPFSAEAAPAGEPAPTRNKAWFQPAPAAEEAAGADVDAAAGPQEAGSGPALVAIADEDPFQAPVTPPPELPASADAPADLPLPAPPAGPVPDSAEAPGEPLPPVPPTRVAALSSAPPRAVFRAPAPADRRTATPQPSAAASSAAEAPGGKRCRDILVKTTLGERLSDADKEHMRRRCEQPRN